MATQPTARASANMFQSPSRTPASKNAPSSTAPTTQASHRSPGRNGVQ